jgi:hypothetical protein
MASVSIIPVIVTQSRTQVTIPSCGLNWGNLTGIEVVPVGKAMVVSKAVEPGGKPTGHCAFDE